MPSTLVPSFPPEFLVEALRNLFQTGQVLSALLRGILRSWGSSLEVTLCLPPVAPVVPAEISLFSDPPPSRCLSQPRASCLVPTAQHGGGPGKTHGPSPEPWLEKTAASHS